MPRPIFRELTDSIKAPIGFVLKPRKRRRILAESKVKKLQNKAIEAYDPTAKKLIVFLVPGADMETGVDKISGGIISIVSLCQETAGMKEIHGAEVIMCTLRNEYLLFKHTRFANTTNVFRFDQIRRYFKAAEEILFHLPEFTCDYFLEYLDRTNRKWMAGLKNLHINILNQNIRLMPPVKVIRELEQVADKVTATTAHQKYCSRAYREEYGIPLHKFSVWISPENYQFRSFREKEELLIASPDQRPVKEEVLSKISTIPDLKTQIIQNLTYEQYKETIAKAKWALTFGEGLDAYIIEPIFSGAIGFAVYNEDFFTPDFKGLRTIYDSYEQLLDRIVEDLRSLDNEAAFAVCQQEQYALCAKYYSYEQYRNNIKAFYNGQYTLP